MHKYYLCIILLCSLFACGKESKPIPQDQKSIFYWKDVVAHTTESQCIYISATIVGAVKNIRSFSIELQPMKYVENDLDNELNIENICEDCPFIPREVSKIIPERTLYSPNKDSAEYFFVYCPKEKAKRYRWRLVISNIFTSFPYVLTPVQQL